MDKNGREWLEICEAKHFIKQVNIKGRNWWKNTKESLKKMRGEDGLNNLVKRMERERKNAR